MKGFNYRYSRKKVLYIILAILIISISSLTLVYAALSVTLNIVGTADISAASWDVHLDNVNVNTQSVSGTAPTITGGTTATFSTKLDVPGDFYEFTIDVINDGTIDAMIESIVKTPTLTTAQAKYLTYEIEYQNGESINTRQLVEKNSFVRLKVRIEFRKDVTADVLPSTAETLNLSFTVVYTQSDGTGNNVMDGGITKAKVVSGDYDTVGSEVCIEEECFNVISSDETSVTMLAKNFLGINGRQVTLSNNVDYAIASATFDSINLRIQAVDEGLVDIDVNRLDRFAHDYDVPMYDGLILIDTYLSYLKNITGNYEISIRYISIKELISLDCSGTDENYVIPKDEYDNYIYPTCENSKYADWLINVGQNVIDCGDIAWYTSTIDPAYLEMFISQGSETYAIFMLRVWPSGIIDAQDFTTMDNGIRPVITVSKSLF